MVERIHVIDPNIRRRAQVSRELSNWNIHAEIYEDLAEFCQSNPHDGFVFAVDEPDASDLGEMVETMRMIGSPLPVVMYAEQPETESVVSAMRSGALDYLQWPFDSRRLSSTFRRLEIDGRRLWQTQQLQSIARKKVEQLSKREKDVLVRLIDGMSNKQIANSLKISPRTVEIHRGNMMAKLGAQSPAEAVRVALYAGLDQDFSLAA